MSSSIAIDNCQWQFVIEKAKRVRSLTCMCLKSQLLMILVAVLGKMPRFFCRFLFRSSSSSSPVPSPDPRDASPRYEPGRELERMVIREWWLCEPCMRAPHWGGLLPKVARCRLIVCGSSIRGQTLNYLLNSMSRLSNRLRDYAV